VKIFKSFLLISFVSILLLQNSSAMSDLFEQSIDELREDIERKHPINYLLLAVKLFEEDEKDECDYMCNFEHDDMSKSSYESDNSVSYTFNSWFPFFNR